LLVLVLVPVLLPLLLVRLLLLCLLLGPELAALERTVLRPCC
jgi:hypothetical protein